MSLISLIIGAKWSNSPQALSGKGLGTDVRTSDSSCGCYWNEVWETVILLPSVAPSLSTARLGTYRPELKKF